MLDSIITEESNEEKIEEIDAVLDSGYKPKVFQGSDSVEIRYDKQFESMRLLLSQKMNVATGDMTVLQFYNAAENMKKQMEAEAKSFKHKK